MKKTTSKVSFSKSKYALSRIGKKISIFEDSKIIAALPKDISERTWAEILHKEENDMFIFEIREEIIENVLRIGYLHYMERQNIVFTVHCAIEAWLKIIDWHFYRHDPGEDVSALPACFIPKREASWKPDLPPEPSPRDAFCRQRLEVFEDDTKESLRETCSCTSLDYPIVEDIPPECWFPGRVNIKSESEEGTGEGNGSEEYASGTSLYIDENMAAESEVLQKVTDYTSDKTLKEESPKAVVEKKLSRIDRSSGTVGAGGSGGSGDGSAKSSRTRRSTIPQQFGPNLTTRSRATLPPLQSDSRSRLSIISDCRLRNLRLDTQYEVSSEKMDLSPVENVKRK